MAAELMSGDRHVLYLYGISQSRLPNLPTQAGIDGRARIEAIECDGVVCWISKVSGVEFEENLARNMENLDWLTRASVAHQGAIAAVARETEILPARLNTIFRNQDSLFTHVRESLRTLKLDFKRVQGADEWGIKVFALKPAAPPNSKIRSGKEYLQAKAALLPKRQSTSEMSSDLVEFGEALKEIALEAAAPGSVSSGQRGLAFQTTLLVKKADRKKLESIVRKFSKRWDEVRRIECTGPWPPYSFVSRAAKDPD
jgi:hypothetical protein